MSGARGPVLTLDLGNSTLDCMLHGAEPERIRLPRHRPETLAEWLGGRRPSRVIGVSVVPDALDDVMAALQAGGAEVVRVPADVPCPLSMAYETPETLGADRWLAALTAFRRVGAAVVADLGTAVTVDGVDPTGTFLGGCIAPGLGALRAGMGAVTPHLPPVRQMAWAMPPRSTTTALAAGLHLGFAGLVDRLVEEIRQALGGSAPVLVTGGDAHDLLPHLRSGPVYAPDLVHRGLVLAWEAACSS